MDIVEKVEASILFLRGYRVILDSDLARFYGVETKILNKAVRRNAERFPPDFMFQTTDEDLRALRFQIGTSKGRGGRRYKPYLFTQEGVAMLSGLLRSPNAVRVNIAIMRAFVRIGRLLSTHRDLERKMVLLEHQVGIHEERISGIFKALRALMREEGKPKRQIGFTAKEPPGSYRASA
jgi:hypothetical protein